jgi:cell division protein FtsW (lipid II flippase)
MALLFVEMCAFYFMGTAIHEEFHMLMGNVWSGTFLGGCKMLYCLLAILAGFGWLMLETDCLRVRLPAVGAVAVNRPKTTVLDDVRYLFNHLFEHLLLFTSGLALVMVFAAIKITGRFWFEDVSAVLHFELCMAAMIMIFGLIKFSKGVQRWFSN